MVVIYVDLCCNNSHFLLLLFTWFSLATECFKAIIIKNLMYAMQCKSTIDVLLINTISSCLILDRYSS